MNTDDKHILSLFNAELQALHELLAEMVGYVEEQLKETQELLDGLNIALVDSILGKASKVNRMEIKIDRKCAQVLARYSPLAGDLRTIITTQKVVADIERIGDECERIAKEVNELLMRDSSDAPLKSPVNIDDLVMQVRELVQMGVNAYLRVDVEAAHQVIEKDRRVDEIYTDMLKKIAEHMRKNSDYITGDTSWLWIVRSLERIGDHSCNIAEYTIYLEKGKDIRHGDKE